MKYKVYGTEQVNAAKKQYDTVMNSAPTYKESNETKQARTQMNSAQTDYTNAVNTGYQSRYGNRINALAKQYEDNKFSWNKEESPEYHVYEDYYRREGNRAQEDTQGSYSANTGGYSNSYAQAAGQRAYGQQMEQLAAKIPALRNTALQDWRQKQSDLMNQISMLKGFDDTDYQRYRDNIDDRYNFMTYYANKYATSQGVDMSMFQQEISQWNTRANAASNNYSTIRQLAEQQYEHKTQSADSKASIAQNDRQNNAYYNYLHTQLK